TKTKNKKVMSNTTNNRSVLAGVVLIALGGLFLLDNFRLLPLDILDHILSFWGIVATIGIVVISSSDNKTPGYIMLGIGSFFILSDILRYELGIRWIDAWEIFWPVAIIFIGVMILIRKDNIFSDKKKRNIDPSNRDMLNITAILGGGNVSVKSDNFQGGKVTAFMGGGDYDLSASQLAEGDQEIDVFCMFGGATFIVPSDWNVRLEVTSIFGGFSDSRKLQESNTGSDRELVIRGTVIFGGGEIKNYV
ncbi:MAG: cell wall-active antibiotics response protein, partial [bacterium]|nr:cell wall-active antibiotics response protein [bacterium]